MTNPPNTIINPINPIMTKGIVIVDTIQSKPNETISTQENSLQIYLHIPYINV